MQKENILLTKHRKSFRDSIKSVTDIPDLLSVQKESFNLLVQAGVDPDKRLVYKKFLKLLSRLKIIKAELL